MREPTKRSYLMCPPTHFDVTYAINPWMDPAKPVDPDLAMLQWERLRDLYVALGHRVDVVDPVAGLPDMVFAANGATIVDGKVLMARFRYEERAPEAGFYRAWFQGGGFDQICDPVYINEGQGDYLFTGSHLLAGTGFRTDRHAHDEAQELFGVPVISLTLVDPRFYHLDTAAAVLGPDEIMYYPPAFAPGSQAVLRRLYPDAILADDHDAEAFGLNAVSDGRNVVLPAEATHLIGVLRDRGYEPVGVDMSEFRKSGGAVKCCTLELR